MFRPLADRLFAVTAALLAVTSCGKADAAARSGVAGATTASASATPQGAGATIANTVSSASPLTPAVAGADSLSDSLIIARADHGRLIGRDSAAIWVVMISDFQCPYCKQWHDASFESVKRDYISTGRVRMAYLNFPLPQHKFARVEAEAAMCAAVQDKFWPFAEALFKRQEVIEKLTTIQPEVESVARSLALDMKAFAACQSRQAIRALVESDAAQSSKIGVRSTPSFLIGDFLVEGSVPYADFRKAIDTALVLARNAKRTR